MYEKIHWITSVNSELILNHVKNIHNLILFIKLPTTVGVSCVGTIKNSMLAIHNAALHLMQILFYWNKHWVDSRKRLIRKQQGIADGIRDNWTLTHMYSIYSILPKVLFFKCDSRRCPFAVSQSQRQRNYLRKLNIQSKWWFFIPICEAGTRIILWRQYLCCYILDEKTPTALEA